MLNEFIAQLSANASKGTIKVNFKVGLLIINQGKVSFRQANKIQGA